MGAARSFLAAPARTTVDMVFKLTGLSLCSVLIQVSISQSRSGRDAPKHSWSATASYPRDYTRCGMGYWPIFVLADEAYLPAACCRMAHDALNQPSCA